MKKGYSDIHDSKIRERTGKSTVVWNKILDKFNVRKHGHTLAARYL